MQKIKQNKKKNKDEFRLVGKIKDAHNLKGECYALIFSKDTSWLKKLKIVKLSKAEQDEGSEFEVEKAKPHKDGLIIKFKNVLDRTQAEKLKGLLFLIPQKLFESTQGEEIYLAEIETFEVFNNEDFIGIITGFQNHGAHDILVVENEELNKNYEIPFVKEFILDIDFDNEQIFMQLPEGLLNINDKD